MTGVARPERASADNQRKGDHGAQPIGATHDPAEREADRLADLLTGPPPAQALHCAACAGSADPRPACRSGLANLRRSATGADGPTSASSTRIDRALSSPGTPLPDAQRSRFERRLGTDLSALRLHTGPEAADAARSLHARAFASGTDIAWGTEAAAPSSTAGERLLAHEVAHVVCGHAGLRRNDLPGIPPLGPSGGVTVTLGATTDPLSAYGWLLDALGLEGWGVLNDAARLRASRQRRRTGGGTPTGEEQDLALGARDTIRLPVANLLVPRPESAPDSFHGVLFESLPAGRAGFGSGAAAITDEVSRRWAGRHPDLVQGDVEIRLVDPAGSLETPAELLFMIQDRAVSCTDGRLWIRDVDEALTPGELAGVVEEVGSDANEVADAAILAGEIERLLEVVRGIQAGSHEDVSANEAENLGRMLTRNVERARDFCAGHAAAGPLLERVSSALGAAATGYEPWLAEHRRAIAAATPERNVWEQDVDRTAELIRMQEQAPWWAAGWIGRFTHASALSHGMPDLLSGGAVSSDVALRRAFRRGDVSIRGLREGEPAIQRRGLIVGTLNLVVMVGTLGLGAWLAPATLGGQVAFGAVSTSLGTGIVLTTQTALTQATTLPDPMAQQIWQQGAMSPGQIALAMLGAGLLGGACAGVLGWLSRGANAVVARQLVAESMQSPGLVRQIQPGVTARGVGPGVVEVVQEGQPGVLRFTLEGWEARVGQEVVSERWVAPAGAAGNTTTGSLRGLGAFAQPGATPFGVAVGEEGWMLVGPGRSPLATGAWGPTPSGGVAAGPLPTAPGAPLAVAGGPRLLLPESTAAGPAATPPVGRAGQLFVDVQGGPALRADTGQPTFLPSLVAATPGASGVLLEPADYVLGYGGITTISPRDLAFARMLAQNLPQWPSPGPGIVAPPPAPWVFDPRLAFPTEGPVRVLTTPGAPGTTPIPQAFFPPVGGDVVPGVPRQVPIATGGRTAQQDVTRLQPSTHPELHGQVDRVYWRRPFGLATADPATTAAMGREIARWLKPGGFLELRLLRGGEEAQARAIAAQIPDARVISVPRGAIAAYARNGQRPPRLSNEQWAVLQEAGADIRGEFAALGEGQFARIVRIYRGGPAPQRELVVGAEQAEEFDWAAGLQAGGQDVTVANPATSRAAQQFRSGGGNLVTGGIESLPRDAGYNVIREDFPFPLGRVFQPTRAFAQERINRLLPGGRWVVATESEEFATTLEAAVTDLDITVTRTTAPLAHERTPSSPWLPETARQRFVLVFTQRQAARSGP